MVAIIISAVVSILVAGISFAGVVYQTNKTYSKQRDEITNSIQQSNAVFKQEFQDYKEFLHQINKDLKSDIITLSNRVDQHNNFGIQIPVIEEKIKRLDARMEKVEGRLNKLEEL